MKIEIKKAAKKDTETLFMLIKELARFEKLEKEVSATSSQLKKTLFNKNPTAHALIVWFNKKPIGFVLYFYNYSTFLGQNGIYIEDLFVMPNYRSKGIGKKLLQKIAQIGKKSRCGRIEWSVLNWNQRAIQFYLTLGARPMNAWTTYRLNLKQMNQLAILK